MRPHSGTKRLKVINQVGESVASVGSSEEDDFYRNDSMKSAIVLVINLYCFHRISTYIVELGKRKKGRRFEGL